MCAVRGRTCGCLCTMGAVCEFIGMESGSERSGVLRSETILFAAVPRWYVRSDDLHDPFS